MSPAYHGGIIQTEPEMRKIILAATCLAFIGGVSAASAQSTGPSGQTTAVTGENMSNGMNANAMSMSKKKMMMKKKRKMMMMKKKGMM